MPSWVEALKEWNSGKGTWCIPRRGTKDYDEVRALMGEKAKPAKKAAAPKALSADEEWAKENWKRTSTADRIRYYKQVKKSRLPPQEFARRGYEAWLKKESP